MPTVTVVYPRAEGAIFDFDYYERVHLPLVAKSWADAGLTGAKALRGMAGGDGGDPPFVAIALIGFATMDSFQAAMAGPHSGKILADVANFTNIQPVIQVNETIGA